MTAEEIVRLLVEELSNHGRGVYTRDPWNDRIGIAYNLSNPLKQAAKEWVRLNGTGA